ncbi:unnamed protein product [Citrullus colocynthis]|uniref:Uncharacterized protein n=1 Tax=Citrullus colocynthis TaxID=252529 RepID=A0ABP0XYG2_9ROSI
MAWCREGAREEDRDMKKKAMEEAHGSARGGTTQRSAIECDPAGGQPAAEKPSRWTSGFWEKLTSCFVPQTQDGGDSISPTEPIIANWIEDVDLPRESPSETLPNLRKKCSILIESFSKTQSRDPLTWQDIAQRLALEGKETAAEVGATREDFQRLLGELLNLGESDVYLRVLRALELHPH